METVKTARAHMAMNNFETVLSICGKVIDLNRSELWTNLDNWYTLYHQQPKSKTIIHFRLEHINTRNVVELFHFVNKLQTIADKSELTIVWEYDAENDDLETLGLDLQSVLQLPLVLRTMTDPFRIQLRNCA